MAQKLNHPLFDTRATDADLMKLKNSIPEGYKPDEKRWGKEQPKEFYLGMIAGINATLAVAASAMTPADQRDYLTKMSVDAALVYWEKSIVQPKKIINGQ